MTQKDPKQIPGKKSKPIPMVDEREKPQKKKEEHLGGFSLLISLSYSSSMVEKKENPLQISTQKET